MTDEGAERLIRQAIGGNGDAMAWIGAKVVATDDPVLLVLAALLEVFPDGRTLLDRAAAAASNREDRQLVAIARAHHAGDRELVDALARDHLVDFPGNYLVAWVASGARRSPPVRYLGGSKAPLSYRPGLHGRDDLG